MTTRSWDLFCRVIDNHGDLGVCWRLAADLAARGDTVRLWVDDAAALAWMAPAGAPGVQVLGWRDPEAGEVPSDVVVEAFGCHLPERFIELMAQRQPPPCWINLEYLSAEPYVRRSHGLPSPQQAGPGAGLAKWFFYPGFSPGTGGLLREPGLLQRRAAFDRGPLLQALGTHPDRDARLVLLFCYDNPALPAWLQSLAQAAATPTWLWVTPGPPAHQVGRWLGTQPQPGQVVRRGALAVQWLPYVAQPRFDELLWSADLNLVRGEDSLVRALWAGQPFVWHIYPQHDGAHAAKLEAFLDIYLDGAANSLAAAVRAVHRHWNGLNRGATAVDWSTLPWAAWQEHASAWTQRQARQADLASELRHFAANRPGLRSS
jgi:uncharacterized repeat protein (TIGR03837 family)